MDFYQFWKISSMKGNYQKIIKAMFQNYLVESKQNYSEGWEEAVELLIESKDNNKQKFIEESADLLFHLLILLNKKNIMLDEIVNELRLRNKK